MHSYVRSESVVSRVIAGETLIIPVRKGVGDLASIYSLNEVASAIWKAIAGPCTTDEIVHSLETEFAGSREHMERDIEVFLHEMQSAGLVNEVGAAA